MPRSIILLLPLLIFLGTAQAAKAVSPTDEQLAFSYAPIVKKDAPAVVNIFAKRVVREQVSVSPFMNDPFFRQFFSQSPLLSGPVQEKVERSLGSGVIIGADGLIVTSNHVVQDAQAISVVLADKREFEAAVIKRDPQTDLAFLHVDTKDPLPSIALRDSETLEVGELVLAIGNPFGIGQTVTHGIISALARPAQGVSDYQFFIQTDAAINPGNSGGALVDMQGRLIGINTAIYSTSGGSNGIGFAIPSNMVKAVQGSEMKGGKVVRPWFGLSTQAVTPEIAESLGMKLPHGALVRQVTDGSPAKAAGIQEGDVIVAVGGNPVADDKNLIYRIGTAAIGSSVEISLLRQGQEMKVLLIPQAPPQGHTDTKTLKGNHPLNGLMVGTLTPALAEEFGLQELSESGGVVVLGGGNGGMIALEKGDLITEVNDTAIHTVAQLEKALAAGKHSWSIVVRRGGGVLSLSVRM